MNAGSAIETLVEGLWLRLRDVVLTEARLEAFAFEPERGGADAGRRLAALVEDEAALGDLALDVTLRALAAAVDGVSYRVLAALSGEPVALAELARAVALPPLAVSERVHALAQLGLASRALDRDAVVGTPAGRGIVALVEAVGAALAARCREGARALL